MLATNDPKLPLSGVGGVNNNSREMPTSIASSSLVFRSRNTVGDYRIILTALSLYLSSVKWRVLRELVLSNWEK